MMDIRLAGLEADSVSNGNGFRAVIYLQGCFHACPGCQNPQTHDMNGGVLTTTDNVILALTKLITPLTKGITLSGGEPFLQTTACVEIASYFRSLKASSLYPEEDRYDIWTYTGFVYEDLIKEKYFRQLLNVTDYLVDGPYIRNLRDLNLQFRGSSNQRILHLVDGLIVE